MKNKNLLDAPIEEYSEDTRKPFNAPYWLLCIYSFIIHLISLVGTFLSLVFTYFFGLGFALLFLNFLSISNVERIYPLLFVFVMVVAHITTFLFLVKTFTNEKEKFTSKQFLLLFTFAPAFCSMIPFFSAIIYLDFSVHSVLPSLAYLISLFLTASIVNGSLEDRLIVIFRNSLLCGVLWVATVYLSNELVHSLT